MRIKKFVVCAIIATVTIVYFIGLITHVNEGLMAVAFIFCIIAISSIKGLIA